MDDTQKYLSQQLIDELTANNIITPSADMHKAQLIIRKFLIDTYRQGVLDEKICANKKHYIDPHFNDIKE